MPGESWVLFSFPSWKGVAEFKDEVMLFDCHVVRGDQVVHPAVYGYPAGWEEGKRSEERRVAPLTLRQV